MRRREREQEAARLRAELAEVESYRAWQRLARALDEIEGLDAWRAEDESPHYDAALLRQHLRDLRARRAARDVRGLADLLDTAIHIHQGGLAEPALYHTAWAGTKHLVTEFLDEVVAGLEFLRDEDSDPAFPPTERLRLFERAAHQFGRSALMLSGGATFGWYHLGVIKALWEQDLLPAVLCGSSMGAMIAAGIATRTDAELAELFENPEQIRRRGLKWTGALGALRRGGLYASEVMMEAVRHNVGDYTFAEAYARTGRVVNISVSPTRSGQKPRILSHVTAPDVWLPSAALASGAVPFAFPAVGLERRVGAAIVPYLPEERWIDGSMRGDLPTRRLGRLFNVNHFIVSQTNPHVLPFLREPRRRSLLSLPFDLAWKTAHAQSLHAASLAAQIANSTPLSPWADMIHALAGQSYRGDIDIHPRFQPTSYRKLFVNASLEDLLGFIRGGEMAAWPHIVMIRDQTRVSRTFDACVAALRARVGAPAEVTL
jgi:TAG lipase/steryl ester hydrolase/phospholipase A2/LPA acyltransferase